MYGPSDYLQYSLLRAPNWRYQRVMDILNKPGGPGRCSVHDDAIIRKARAFIPRWNAMSLDERKRRLVRDDPALYFAYELYDSQSWLLEPTGKDKQIQMLQTIKSVRMRYGAVQHLEACLLAGMDDAGVHARTGMYPPAIPVYEALFFNVRDRLQFPDWVVRQVLVPAYLDSKIWVDGPTKNSAREGARGGAVAQPFDDATVKLFAYFGGVHALDAVARCWAGLGQLQTPDDIGNWCDVSFSKSIKMRTLQAAQFGEINRYNMTELFAVNTRIRELEADSGGEAGRNREEQLMSAILKELPLIGAQDAGYLAALPPTAEPGAAEPRDSELLGGPPTEKMDEYTPHRRKKEVLK